MPEITGTFTVDPLTDENKITILTLQNDNLCAALDAMTKELDGLQSIVKAAERAAQVYHDLHEKAEAALDAAQVHNADLSASMEGWVRVARARALGDACQKLADVLAFGYRENVIVREAFSQAAKEISAMIEQEAKEMSAMIEQEDKG